MNKRNWIIIGVVLLACLTAGLWSSRPGRLLRGISILAIRNDSDSPLTNVTLTVLCSNRGSTLPLPREVAAHKSLRLPFHEPVALVGATFSWRGQLIGYGDRPLASDTGEVVRAGQVLTVAVSSSGTVAMIYD